MSGALVAVDRVVPSLANVIQWRHVGDGDFKLAVQVEGVHEGVAVRVFPDVVLNAVVAGQADPAGLTATHRGLQQFGEVEVGRAEVAVVAGEAEIGVDLLVVENAAPHRGAE